MIALAGRIAAGVIDLANGGLAGATAGPAGPAPVAPDSPGRRSASPTSPQRSGRQWIFPELRSLRARVWVGGLSWTQVAVKRPTNPIAGRSGVCVAGEPRSGREEGARLRNRAGALRQRLSGVVERRTAITPGCRRTRRITATSWRQPSRGIPRCEGGSRSANRATT